MKIARRAAAPTLPGLAGTARVSPRADVLPRLRPGDVAVLQHTDLAQDTARALVRAEVAAVVTAQPLVSGRYPSLGPQVLAESGIPVVDRIGPEGFAAIRDGARLRVHDGNLYAAGRADTEDAAPLARGRRLDPDSIRTELADAHHGMVVQLESLTHNAAELLRREHDLVLGGARLPVLNAQLTGRPVVVVAPTGNFADRLKKMETFLREQEPVILAVDEAADACRTAGHQPHVVLLSATAEVPTAKTVRKAKDVLVVAHGGVGQDTVASLYRLGVRPALVESAAAATEVALLLAVHRRAAVIVSAGATRSLDDLLDRHRHEGAGAVLAGLQAGPRLIDSEALPALYGGRIRVLHLLLVLLAGLVAVAAAIAVTPVGAAWFADLAQMLRGLLP